MTDTATPPAAPAPAATTRTMPARLLDHARTNPAGVALRHKHLGISQEYTWADYSDAVRKAGLALRALGVGPGESVAVLSENRPEWVFADVGTQGIGAVAAGIYPTSPAPEVRYILEHSEAKVLIAEDEEQYDKAVEVWDLSLIHI